ncbi:cytochrome P450 [[Mycobacterium] burgundiense]|uniref:Cytochrome P450 n=1 Tax=[Mycobacterium] burgundiense TaxID=3064286 RepID=A0ABM9LKI3_9MYCO|nr:cytochrome P450 [Mycolicibacterium sp. MU0053]CAJ1500554.1 cytochrome P450 [Mycolicibacterium sp. MU0053]
MPELAGFRDHFNHTIPGFSQRALDVYRTMREHCPITRSDQLGGFWVVSNYDATVEILSQPDVFVSAEAAVIPALPFPCRGIPNASDPPLHHDYRGVLMPFLTPDAVARHEPMVRETVGALIDSFIGDGEADFVAQFASRLPCQVTAGIFGFERHDAERCYGWLSEMLNPPDGDPITAAAAADSLHEFFVGMLAASRAEPDGNLISAISSHVRAGAGQFSDEECIALVFSAVGAALETTVSALTSIVVYLDQLPSVRAQLITNPSLVDRAVQEVLRMAPPAHCRARTVRRNVEVGGVTFKAADRVLLLFGSANYDGRRFATPESFRLDRSDNPHLSFGHGIHSCLGAGLAQLEMRVTLEEILKRMPDIQVISGSGPVIKNGAMWDYETLGVQFIARPVVQTS